MNVVTAFNRVMGDLFKNDDGRVSTSKFWLNVAYTAATVCFVILAVQGTLTVDMFIAYVLTVSGNSLADKWMKWRYGKGSDDTQK